jgi:hypothetical protein
LSLWCPAQVSGVDIGTLLPADFSRPGA